MNAFESMRKTYSQFAEFMCFMNCFIDFQSADITRNIHHDDV